MRIGIVAGEASGDLLGANLINALRAHYPQLQIEGIGGPLMIAAGCKSLFAMERLSVMGFFEPLKRLPDLIKLRWDISNHFIKNPPDVFIGIDAPDFNLGLELQLRAARIPIVHYVSPSVWAWRQYRIRKIAKAVDLILTLFPFEIDFYKKHSVPASYVGHPLFTEIPLVPDQLAARRQLKLEDKGIYVGLLPGSRKQELNYLGPAFLQAAKLAYKERPELRFITTQINEARYHEFYALYQKIAPELPLTFYLSQSQAVMSASDVLLVTSGTATLEAMLYKVPMIIAYKMSRLTYQLAKFLVKTPFIGLPNLLAKKLLVPELIQDEVTPERLKHQLFDYLDHPTKMSELKREFMALHQDLEQHVTPIANCILDVLKKRDYSSVS